MAHEPQQLSVSTAPQSPRRRASALTLGLWLVGLGLLVNAGVQFFRPASPHGGWPAELSLDRPAFGQNVGAAGMLGARGIYMMPAQLGPAVFGVYIIDLDSSTLVVYRAVPESNRFRLMAARSFKNDRFLEDFNNDSPTPKEVKKLVDQQRARLELAAPDTQPAETRPDEKKD